MAKNTQSTENVALEALWSMVCDHGDAFRWSISKRGRIWLTLTHWDSEKYNTSVEVDPTGNVSDILAGVAVLCVAHSGKCFATVAHEDTWTDIQTTREHASAAMDVLRQHGVRNSSVAGSASPTDTA